MRDEKWEELKGRIIDTFEIVSNERQSGELEGEYTEEIIFTNESGTMKLVRHVKPRVVDQKTVYANRVGSDMRVEKIYSDTETVDMVQLFIDRGGEWQEMDVSALG